MFERPPNGFFVRDLILFNHLRRGGYVSKGFVFEAPDLTNSPIADLNEFQEQLCLLLASLHENQRLQVNTSAIRITKPNCSGISRRPNGLKTSGRSVHAMSGSPATGRRC